MEASEESSHRVQHDVEALEDKSQRAEARARHAEARVQDAEKEKDSMAEEIAILQKQLRSALPATSGAAAGSTAISNPSSDPRGGSSTSLGPSQQSQRPPVPHARPYEAPVAGSHKAPVAGPHEAPVAGPGEPVGGWDSGTKPGPRDISGGPGLRIPPLAHYSYGTSKDHGSQATSGVDPRAHPNQVGKADQGRGSRGGVVRGDTGVVDERLLQHELDATRRMVAQLKVEHSCVQEDLKQVRGTLSELRSGQDVQTLPVQGKSLSRSQLSFDAVDVNHDGVIDRACSPRLWRTLSRQASRQHCRQLKL